MGMLDATKVSSAFKSAYGKVQTDVTKEIGNEAISTGVQVSASTAAGEPMSPNPSRAALYDITGGTVEFVRLELVPDPSSNGHAFLARLPAAYESSSTNPKKGTNGFTNGKYIHETLGGIQIVPTLYGVPYEAKPYAGGTSAKGTGTLIPPGDARDWILNYFSGVFFQENDPAASPAAPTFLECFIYIGKSIQDVTSETKTALDNLSLSAGATGDIITRVSNLDVAGIESVDELDSTLFASVEWLVDVTKGSQSYAATVKATHYLGEVKYTIYNIVKFGGATTGNFVSLSVDIVNDIMRLRADAKVDNLRVNAVRVAIKS